GIIARRLKIDRRELDLGPFRLGHLAPGAERGEAPLEQPFGLGLLSRDEPHRVLVEAGRRGIGFDLGDEAVFVALMRERADRLLGVEGGAHRARVLAVSRTASPRGARLLARREPAPSTAWRRWPEAAGWRRRPRPHSPGDQDASPDGSRR